jgi:hypothetical protein
MLRDPIVEEVRMARMKLEAKFGNDPEKLYRHYLNVQKKICKSRIVNRSRRPIPSLSKAS